MVLLQWQTVAAARGCFFFLLLPLPLSRVYTILRRLFSGGGGSVGGVGATVALLLPLLFLLSFSSFLLFHSPVSIFRFFFPADLPLLVSVFASSSISHGAGAVIDDWEDRGSWRWLWWLWQEATVERETERGAAAGTPDKR